MSYIEYNKNFKNDNSDVPCFLYVIESTSKHFKIGISKSPVNRLNQLKATQGPYVFSLLLCTPFLFEKTARAVESNIHDIFKDKRVNGEWFTLYPEDLLILGFIMYRYMGQYEAMVDKAGKLKSEEEITKYFEDVNYGF